MSARAYAVMPQATPPQVLCGHAPSDQRVQIVELFENTACDCYFYLRYRAIPCQVNHSKT